MKNSDMGVFSTSASRSKQIHRCVAQAAFEFADIGPVNAGVGSQPFLRQTSFGPQSP